MDRAELISRIAATLKQQIGPNVGDEFAKTQAYMASVVLEKLARELSTETQHTIDRQAALSAMSESLATARAQQGLPDVVQQALDNLGPAPSANEICALIEALYGNRAELDNDTFTAMLGAVREYARFDIDQRLTIAE